jgi:regulator of RNase E activity RraA
MRAVVTGSRLAGRVLPVRHVGSVDIFLEAIDGGSPGDVLVIDNDGRIDEACIGDLVVQEARSAGLAGLVVWGLHRDTVDVTAIGLPAFSLGSIPTGPVRLDALPHDALAAAHVGEWTVTAGDAVFADEDGVLFVPADRVADVLTVAESIRDTERDQAEQVRAGTSLREQLGFTDYLARRRENPALTFREHLRTIGGAIEE